MTGARLTMVDLVIRIYRYNFTSSTRVKNRDEKDTTFSSSVSLKLKLPMFAASSEGPFDKNSLDSSPARFRLRLGGVI